MWRCAETIENRRGRKMPNLTEQTTREDRRENADRTATILTLIRRGDSISQISSMLRVQRHEVEKVMDWYVERMMA